MSTPTSEFFQRLIALGYPESVARRIASGDLVMDYASIVQRAKEQGYGDITDPANRFYHGTSADIREILNSESGALGGEGVYITPSPEKASGYAQIAERILHRGTSQNVLPLVTNINNPYHFEDYSNIPIGGINDELLRNLGYDALSVSNKGGPVEELKVPSNRVRSVNAAFDPEYVGPNILGNADPKLLAGLAGGSLLGAAVAPKVKSEETKEVDPFVQALMDYTSDANFLPSPSERLIPMSEIPAEMKANNPDLIRGITNWAGNAMGGDYYDYRAAEGLMNVADFLPYIGGAISTQQGTDAYRNNRKWEGRMLTGLGLIELYPFLGKMASESIKPVIRPTIRNWDKMGAPWEASDGLLKYLESL